MVTTDQQVRRLRQLDARGTPAAVAAVRSGMDAKTACKYRRLGRLPSEVRMPHTWRTHPDPFADVWPGVVERLALNPGLEALTLFRQLQREHPGRFPDGQLRTFQRRVKMWRATAGPSKEVFFAQVHTPGRLCASDFTHMTDLRVTIAGQPFDHLIYHFVLTYSNWETGTVCFAESFETLAEGLQNALAELGGVPAVHRTDRLTAVDAPRQSGLRQPRVVPGLPPRFVRSVEREPGEEEEPGDGRVAEAAGVSLRVGGSVRRARRCGEHDRRAGEHVFGVEPVDRRAGRGAVARRTRGGVVRAATGGADAAVAWPGPAPDRLPSRDRLAGPQAGRVRGVPLSRGPVPDDDIPHRLRRVARASEPHRGPGILAVAAARGA